MGTVNRISEFQFISILVLDALKFKELFEQQGKT